MKQEEVNEQVKNEEQEAEREQRDQRLEVRLSGAAGRRVGAAGHGGDVGKG